MSEVKAYKFKLYHAKRNRHLHRQIDIAGRIWNHCIALHRRYYRLTGKHLNQYQLMAHLTELKRRPRYADWNLVGAQAIQDIVQRIERSYALFFRNFKAGVTPKPSPPGFRKVRKYSSFTLKQTGWKILGDNRVTIQGRVYKFSKSREIPAEVKTVTVKRDTLGDLWLYFVVSVPDTPINRTMSGHSAGFDFGLKAFLTTDTGQVIESPLYYREAMVDLKHAQQVLARKVKGSRGWRAAKQTVARIQQRVVNKRRDFFFKLAHTLTDRYDTLYFEDLNMKGMQRLWGRKVGDLARSEFMGILEYVARVTGAVVQYVDRFYPSSKTCSACGWIYHGLQLAERTWTCAHCQANHDRDRNAAINIRREGASSRGLGEVRPERPAFAV
jgi:putative transposase